MAGNSAPAIKKRVTAGKITWTGVLIMLTARSVLAVICQALGAAIFYTGSVDAWGDAWEQAGQWWTVYGTLIDGGCIVLLIWLTRREGIRLFDLGNYRREGWPRDVLLGLGLWVLIFPILLLLPIMIIGGVLYGGPPPPADNLPVVALLYSLFIWVPIWVFAEDNTYLGYSLPRLEALTGRTWLAVIIVSFFLALQHVFLPLRLEWQWFVYRFATMFPFAIVFSLLYLRFRRLLPLHVVHWAADVVIPLQFLILALIGGG